MIGLPTIDTGLMNEHLSTHEGLIEKLELYKKNIQNQYLLEFISIQQSVLYEHIRAMLKLLNLTIMNGSLYNQLI